MRIAGSDQTAQVIVPNIVATALGWPVDEMLRVEFEAERSELKALASEKYDRGRATSDGKLLVALSDLVRFDEEQGDARKANAAARPDDEHAKAARVGEVHRYCRIVGEACNEVLVLHR